MIRSSMALSALLSLFLLIGPAIANVKTVTYAGVVSNGYDSTGVFGAPNTNLAGKIFVASYRYDANIGTRTITSSYDGVLGGQTYGNYSPLLKTTVKISENSINIDSNTDYGFVFVSSGLSQAASYEESNDGMIGHDNHVSNFAVFDSNLIPSSLDTSFFRASPDFSGGDVSITAYDLMTGHVVQSAFAFTYMTSVTVASSAPESATWLFMLGGFGMVGTAMRRRISTKISSQMAL